MKSKRTNIIKRLIILLIIVTGCVLVAGITVIQNNQNNSLNIPSGVTTDIIVNQPLYTNAPRDPLTIRNVSLNGSLLTIKVTYGGGCADHDFALVFSEIWIDTNPVGRDIVLAHDAHNDTCRAIIPKVLTFDLSPLRYVYSYGQHQTNGTILLNLEGYGVIRYSFTKPATL